MRVRGERGVLGVRGEGMLSQALYPLGGGAGIVTPERWQQPSASDIQASNSFSLSQSERGDTEQFRGRTPVYFIENTVAEVCDRIMDASAPCALSRASAVKRGTCSMSAVSTISMSFSLRRS